MLVKMTIKIPKICKPNTMHSIIKISYKVL